MWIVNYKLDVINLSALKSFYHCRLLIYMFLTSCCVDLQDLQKYMHMSSNQMSTF